MKKILASRLFTFVLGLVIAGSIGVYAVVKISAEDIEYNEGISVKDKIDDLYIKSNKYDTLTFTNMLSSWKDNASTSSNFQLTQFQNKYKKFKVVLQSGNGTCSAKIADAQWNQTTLNYNQEYLTTAGVYLIVVNNSPNTNGSACNYTFTFYN